MARPPMAASRTAAGREAFETAPLGSCSGPRSLPSSLSTASATDVPGRAGFHGTDVAARAQALFME